MLSSDERAQIEAALQRERTGAVAALQEFDSERSQTLQEEAGEMSVYRFHMADIGTESMEREKHFLLASVEGRRLYDIDTALRRLYGDPEAFGRCERCGREIGFQRLLVVPYATHCQDCQTALEGTAE